ncbi:MAG: T9SS type A sorting domain-containing protein [Bacteroidales bacterium]|nr:T9SS type A sorting domain-containing protein [Bacteroidales bacterium]
MFHHSTIIMATQTTRRRKFTLLWILAFLLVLPLQAQENPDKQATDYSSYPFWIDMMDDPGANFYEVQRAFEAYWDGRPTRRGDGYKPFKRWEYFWQLRINPDGTFPEPGRVYHEYQNFVENQPEDGRFKSEQTRWTELGPKTRLEYGGYVGLGRLNDIACHPTDTSIIYVGAPSGGVWKTTNGGRSWFPKSDNLPSLGVSSILIHPTRHDELLVGTGDRDHGDARGIGVLFSPDGGNSWEIRNQGMGEVTVGMMTRHETNPDIVLAATSGGIFKTTDGGISWARKSSAGGHYKDIKYKPGDMNVAYASATNPTGFYRSEDGGESWSVVPAENGVPEGGRIVIGVSPAANSIVYIVAGATAYQGCFVSTDEGRTFTAQSTSPNILGYAPDGSDNKSQAWYDLSIYVDPENSQIIHVGGINMWRSDNGGKNWTLTAHWVGSGAAEVHADQHTFGYNPVNKRLYAGNDGGIYYTDDKGTRWVEITEGLGIGQIYKLGVSATNPHKTVTGFQDNGSATWIGGDWMSSGGGDGMECAIDPFDYQYSYTTLYYGSITQYLFNGSYRNVAGEGVGGIDESGAWVTPFIIHKADGNTMLVGYKNVWITHELKHPSQTRWKKISNSLAGRNDMNISVLEQSGADLDMLYMVRSDRKLFRTDNFNAPTVVWRDLSAGLPDNGTPSDIKGHPFDPNVVYMTLNRKIYKSVDKGENWFDISGSLPSISFFTIAFDQTTEESLYLGSDAGVYYKASDSDDWVLYNNGMPAAARITELEIYYDHLDRNGSRIRAATFGRGMWEAGLAPENPLLAPVFLSAESTGEHISLTWNAPFYPQHVTGYKILRNGSFWDNTTAPYYTDIDVTKGVSYTYQVVALYEGGMESPGSNQVMAMVTDPVLLPWLADYEEGTDGFTANFFHGGWQHGSSSELGIPGNDGQFFGIRSDNVTPGMPVADYLISPSIDLGQYAGSTVTLRFRYAFYNSWVNDRFSIAYRTSPESDWVEFFKFDDPRNQGWEWKEQSLVLPQDVLKDDVELAFHYSNDKQLGGGAAIDHIELFPGSASVMNPINTMAMRVYPNPSDGKVTLEIQSENPGQAIMRIFNITGQSVANEMIELPTGKTAHSIDLSHLPKGVYTLIVKDIQGEVKEKITLR